MTRYDDRIRNKVKDAAETIGLPTFTVADAGRTQVNHIPFYLVRSWETFKEILALFYAGFCWFENCPCCRAWFVSPLIFNFSYMCF